MTPVSFAPVTPAVRGANASGRASKADSGDQFESLLAHTSNREDDRGSAAGRNDSKGLTKAPGSAARPPVRRKPAGSEAGDTATSKPTGESGQTVKAKSERDADGEKPVDADRTTKKQEEQGSHTVTPIVTSVAAQSSSPGAHDAASSGANAVCDEVLDLTEEVAAPETASSAQTAVSQETGDALDAVSSQAATALDAGETGSEQRGDAGQAFEHAGKARGQASTQSMAGPGDVKSASWIAAASALRQALQKSALSEPEHAASQQGSTAAAKQNAESAGAEARSSLAAGALLPNVRSALAEAKAADLANPNAGDMSLEEAAIASLATASTSSARQQSAGSHQDFGDGSAGTYKAPLKSGAPTLVLSAPEAFARALEPAAPQATAGLPPSFSSSHLSTVGPQIVKGLQMQVTAGGGDMRLTLSPEHLGTVSIDVRVVHDRVTATLMADSPAVRQWISTHQDDLRQRLDAAGLKLDDLVVKEDGRREGQEPQGERQAPEKRRTPRGAGTQPVFEVVA
jgi:flagellar hook-length control protein FliK